MLQYISGIYIIHIYICYLHSVNHVRYWILTSIGYLAPTTHSKIKARLVSVYGISLRIPACRRRIAFHARQKIRSSRSTEKTSRTFANYCTLAWITTQLRYCSCHRRRRTSLQAGIKADSFFSSSFAWRWEITLARAVSLFKTDHGALERGLHSLTVIPSHRRPRITTKLSHFCRTASRKEVVTFYTRNNNRFHTLWRYGNISLSKALTFLRARVRTLASWPNIRS